MGVRCWKAAEDRVPCMPTWVAACAAEDVDIEDVIGFHHEDRDYAIYRTADGEFFATDGHCTHERTLLCDGLVMGHVIECPKHNGRFDIRTGKAIRAPVLKDIQTFPTKVEDGTVFVFL
jgi:3-phenylpropionate/trans-cinnamate dioxygenase ferredoxin component